MKRERARERNRNMTLETNVKGKIWEERKDIYDNTDGKELRVA